MYCFKYCNRISQTTNMVTGQPLENVFGLTMPGTNYEMNQINEKGFFNDDHQKQVWTTI